MKRRKPDALKCRECCADREILQKGHREDVSEWKKTLFLGEDFCDDIVKIEALMEEISQNKSVSQADKNSVMVQLKQIAEYIQSSYTQHVEMPSRDILESISNRIDDISAEIDQRKLNVQAMERMLWNTDVVNKHQLIQIYNDLYTRHQFLFEETSHDSYVLMKKAAEQRNRIRKYTTKR